MTIFSFVVTCLAVARLTRLVTEDRITEPLRAAVTRRARDGSAWTYLIHCTACTSTWVAAAVLPGWWWYGTRPWFLVPAAVLAASQVAVLLLSWERD